MLLLVMVAKRRTATPEASARKQERPLRRAIAQTLRVRRPTSPPHAGAASGKREDQLRCSSVTVAAGGLSAHHCPLLGSISTANSTARTITTHFLETSNTPPNQAQGSLRIRPVQSGRECRTLAACASKDCVLFARYDARSQSDFTVSGLTGTSVHRPRNDHVVPGLENDG